MVTPFYGKVIRINKKKGFLVAKGVFDGWDRADPIAYMILLQRFPPVPKIKIGDNIEVVFLYISRINQPLQIGRVTTNDPRRTFEQLHGCTEEEFFKETFEWAKQCDV